MRYPEFLKEHDTIGFAAPSFGAATEPYKTAFQAALAKFKEEGFGVHLGPNVYEGSGIGISNTPEKCGKELTEMYVSPENQALLSTGGGELMCEILDYVDFEKVKAAAPKWFLGYSDNTNFSFLLPTLCDTAALYGPCAPSFGMDPRHACIQDAYNLLRGRKLTFHGYNKWEKEGFKDAEHPLESYNTTEKTVVKLYHFEKGQQVSGRFIGGCLDILANLAGTKYDHVAEFAEKYKDDGIIWFMEACDLNVFSIRRALWELKSAGWFKHVKAFVIGRPYCMGQEFMGLDQYEAVLYHLRAFDVPVIMDADLGHLPPAMPFINGGYGTLTTWRDNIKISYELK